MNYLQFYFTINLYSIRYIAKYLNDFVGVYRIWIK